MKKIFLILSVLSAIILFPACDLMFGMFEPDFSGSWSVTEDNGLFLMKTTYTFSRTEYELTTLMLDSEANEYDISIQRGLASSTDTTVTITPLRSKDIAIVDWGEKTFDDVDWVNLTGDDAEPGTISWAIKDDTLTLTIPGEAEGDTPAVIAFKKVEEITE